METVHREIIRKNYSDLVQAIQRVEEVVDKLVQFNVLTCLMKAEIMEKLSFDRARELLNMLRRRGPQAYTLFCKALEECGEIQALTLLGLETDQEMTELQDPRCHLHLGDNVYVTAKTWDDVLSIHVRKYEVYPSGMAYPTKRGIVLSLKHWMELPGAIRSIEEAVKEGKPNSQWHLGANVFVTMDSTGIEIRQCCWDNSMQSMVPRAKGILLSMDQWKKLGYCVEVMADFVPELKNMVPCMAQEDHQNQMGYLMCSFCNPSGYDMWSN
ncbi:uncharacterized protein [Haliotis asinina]|uniref:uncharacterized protein n=1 Tax=Haliotis asinina TaxID=109174 RepID=UPI0035327CDB